MANCPGFAVPPVTSAASASVAATVMTGKSLSAIFTVAPLALPTV
ncbi:hypothetical protein U9R62_07830 [Cylindrospermopsis raciborskii DSH]